MFLSIQDCLLIQFVVSAVMTIHITLNNDRNGRNNNRNGNGDMGDVRDVGLDIMYINPNSLSARYTWNRGLDVGLDIMYINPNIGPARYTWNRGLAFILLPVEKLWQVMYAGKKYWENIDWYHVYLRLAKSYIQANNVTKLSNI